jgi:hypothetical protein
MPDFRTRHIPILAQDTGVRSRGRILLAHVPVPWEDLEPGPIGHRVHVVDYDSTTRTLYSPAPVSEPLRIPRADALILSDPAFHALNVYALVMRTLQRFELALGRRVGWAFRAHQIKVIPHAFEAENAFYSAEAEALLFGYYRTRGGPVFTCLSHDIVVHEATHALLDGLRSRFLAPSSPDQAAFHEGLADIIAIFSVFSLPEVLGVLIDLADGRDSSSAGLIAQSAVEPERLKASVLFGLADQMAPEIDVSRVNALRRSVTLEPDRRILSQPEYLEPHRRGEVFVAAMARAFLEIWSARLASLGAKHEKYFERSRVVEEGATIADLMLTVVIRALDYTPPIHITFGDFLSALLTVDTEIRRDDTRYRLRSTLRNTFAAYGISPATDSDDGTWTRSEHQLAREGVRLGSLQTDPIEMFRLIWANRNDLVLAPTAYTRVNSIRPSLHMSADDGLPIRETVAECTQYVSVSASELRAYGLRKPPGMPQDTVIVLEGGSTLILDEYGGLKYEIHNRLPNRRDEGSVTAAQGRLDYLWEHGHFEPGNSKAVRIATMHRARVLGTPATSKEAW